MPKLPQVGDVIVSKRFVGLSKFYTRDAGIFPIPVSRIPENLRDRYEIRNRCLSEDERVRMAARPDRSHREPWTRPSWRRS